MKPAHAIIGDAIATLRGSRAQARHAVRVVTGALAAFVIYHAFGLPQGYWAVFTVVVVMQASIGGALGAAIDRAKGTALGAVVGALAAWPHPPTLLGLGLAPTLAVGITAFAAALRPSLRIAPVTAVIMVISPVGGTVGPLAAAAYRVAEIVLGGTVGVLATLFIFPASSTGVVTAKAAQVLEQMARLLESHAADLSGLTTDPRHQSDHGRIRAALEGVEAAMADADRERRRRIGKHRLSEALPRTLWRVRNDTISISRALTPLPEAVMGVIGPTTSASMTSQAPCLRRCGDALVHGTRSTARIRRRPWMRSRRP